MADRRRSIPPRVAAAALALFVALTGGALHAAEQPEPGSYEAAAMAVRERAEAGDTSAMRELATLYKLGQGVPMDFAQAERWMDAAARKGDPVAQTYVAIRDRKTAAVSPEQARLIEALRRDAEAGDAAAAYELGMLYVNGIGVPKDPAQAAAWMRRSADKGKVEAQRYLGFCYESGRGVAQAYAAALTWYRKAAAANSHLALAALGRMYLSGRGVQRDPVTAWTYLKKAEAAGSGTVARDIEYIENRMTDEQKAAARQRLAGDG